MKTLIKHKEYLKDIYWAQNKQKLYFTSDINVKRLRKNRKYYNLDEIRCEDKHAFTIQTLDCVDKELWASTPYIKTEGDFILITVKKFGYLTDEDIEKAIRRYLKYVDFIAYNVFWRNKQIIPYEIKDYEL